MATHERYRASGLTASKLKKLNAEDAKLDQQIEYALNYITNTDNDSIDPNDENSKFNRYIAAVQYLGDKQEQVKAKIRKLKS